jgi:hypothetical protein
MNQMILIISIIVWGATQRTRTDVRSEPAFYYLQGTFYHKDGNKSLNRNADYQYGNYMVLQPICIFTVLR